MLTRTPKAKKRLPRGTWKLQDAKARLSEVVRRAQTDGPQHVTVHGKRAVVILSAEDYAKTRPADVDTRTGEELIKTMQVARKLGLKLEPARTSARVRPPIDFSEDGR